MSVTAAHHAHTNYCHRMTPKRNVKPQYYNCGVRAPRELQRMKQIGCLGTCTTADRDRLESCTSRTVWTEWMCVRSTLLWPWVFSIQTEEYRSTFGELRSVYCSCMYFSELYFSAYYIYYRKGTQNWIRRFLLPNRRRHRGRLVREHGSASIFSHKRTSHPLAQPPYIYPPANRAKCGKGTSKRLSGTSMRNLS